MPLKSSGISQKAFNPAKQRRDVAQSAPLEKLICLVLQNKDALDKPGHFVL